MALEKIPDKIKRDFSIILEEKIGSVPLSAAAEQIGTSKFLISLDDPDRIVVREEGFLEGKDEQVIDSVLREAFMVSKSIREKARSGVANL